MADDYVSRGLGSVLRRHGEATLAAANPAPSSGREPDHEELPSELASYPIFDLIGRGEMGPIYRGSDPALGRTLAIKVLARRHADDPELVARFEQEARICSRLQHPGIVPVYGSGKLDDGRPYFTMEVVDGETLAELLARESRDPALRQRHLNIFARICQTMAYVHASGVVHGNLRPGNVMVGAFGEIQVMDWGLARGLDDSEVVEAERSAAQETILGTPAYMAPEQAKGDALRIGPSTDVFSLGAILCEILTGAPPYSGTDRGEVHLAASRGWLQDARQRVRYSGAAERLVELALRCLAADPEDRPEDAHFVEAEIATYLESVELRARESEREAVTARVSARHERRSRRIVTALGSALVAAIVLASGLLLWNQAEASSHRADTRDAVDSALARALRLHGRARQQPPKRMFYWAEAVAAARQAHDFAVTANAPAALQAHVAAVVTEIESDRGEAERTRQLLDWLEEIRPHLGEDCDSEQLEAIYAGTLARHGFDIDDRETANVAAALAASPISESLIRALEDWAFLLRRDFHSSHRSWRELLEIASLADRDAWRQRMRSAFARDDFDELARLANDLDLRNSPAQTINLLGRMLLLCRRPEEAIRLMRDALSWHPQDFWILHDLAVALRDREPTPHEEILGLCRACVAVRPDSAHAWSDYAFSLNRSREYHRAIDALTRATSIDADYTRAWRILAWSHLALNQHAEGLHAANRAVLTSPHFEGHRLRAESLLSLGRSDEALAAARRAVAGGPGDFRSRFALARVFMELQSWQKAEAVLREASAIAPSDPAPHDALIPVLSYLGRFDDALVAAQTARDLTERGPSSRLGRAEHSLRGAAARAAAARRLQDGPPTRWTLPVELAWMAQVASYRGDHRRAYRWYRRAHDAEPTALTGHRWGATRVAARAGRGLIAGLTGEERVAARELTRELITAELAAGRSSLRRGRRSPASLTSWAGRLAIDPLLTTLWHSDSAWRSLAEDLRRFRETLRGP